MAVADPREAYLKEIPHMKRYMALMERFKIHRRKRLMGRPYALWQLALGVNHLDGDTVECGVGNGRSSHVICQAMKNKPRAHHVFDSFLGLAKPGPEDKRTHIPWSEGDCAYQFDRVRQNLKDNEQIRYWPGWIPERFHEVEDERFALVHVDVDLFQATWDSLRFFFPRVVPGGLLICDDYSSPRCPGARKAVNDYSDATGVHAIHLPSGAAFFIKPADGEDDYD